jgi:hypothetical protein
MKSKFRLISTNGNDSTSCNTKFRVTKIRKQNPWETGATVEVEPNCIGPQSFANFQGTAQEIACDGLEDLLSHLIRSSADEAIVTGLVHRNKKYKPQCRLQWNKIGDFDVPRLWPGSEEKMFVFRPREPGLFVFSAVGDRYAADDLWARLCTIEDSLRGVGYLRISRPYDEAVHSTLQCEVLRELTTKAGVTNPNLHEFCCIVESGFEREYYTELFLDRLSSSRWWLPIASDVHDSDQTKAIVMIDGFFPGYVLNPLANGNVNHDGVTCELRSGDIFRPTWGRGHEVIVGVC